MVLAAPDGPKPLAANEWSFLANERAVILKSTGCVESRDAKDGLEMLEQSVDCEHTRAKALQAGVHGGQRNGKQRHDMQALLRDSAYRPSARSRD